MSNVIQIKRGQGIPNKKLNAYELGFSVTNGCLYIGSDDGKESNCIPVMVEKAKGLENQPTGVWYLNNGELTGLTLVTTQLQVGEINPVIGGNSDNNAVISAGALRWWNGAHTKEEDGTFKSNLQYCDQGRFTSAAVSTIASPATSNPNNASGYGVGPIPASQNGLLINGETIRWWDGSHTVADNGAVSSNLRYCYLGNFDSFLLKSGGTMTGAIKLPGSKYYKDHDWGIDCSNSDIIAANGIWFADAVDGATEGIHFFESGSRTENNGTITDTRKWSTLYADSSGTLKFHPHRETDINVDGYSVFHSGNYTSLFHLPRINIFVGRTLDGTKPTIEVSFEAESDSNTGDTLTSTRQFDQGNFYLFFAGFGKASTNGVNGTYYNFLLIPQSYIPVTTEDSEARGLVISSGKDAKYFSVRYESATKKMIIKYRGHDGGGSLDKSFGMYCIY